MRLIFLLTFIFFNISTFSQDFNREKLDSLFNYLDEKNMIMGSTAINQNGSTVYQKAFGFSDVELRNRANPQTLYRIGSVSKTFTATVILQLIEEEKLTLETTIDKFFPEIPNAKEITIEHLLSHQSGLVNFTDDPAYSEWLNQPKTKEELIELFTKNGSNFSPGTSSEYSNTNYVLLTFIAEEIEDKDFEKIIRKRIFSPAQLKRSKYAGRIKSKNNEALSYYPKNNWETASETNPSIPLGAGAIAAQADEVSSFFYHLFEGNLLEKSSLKEMTTARKEFGLGLFQLPYRDKKVYGHTGGIDGFQSLAVFFPEEKTAVSLLLNGNKMDLNEVFLGILEIYFGYKYSLPHFEEVKNANQFTGTYSSESFPLKLDIFLENNLLYGQATGQPAFRLNQVDEQTFEFPPAGLQIEFNSEEKTLKLTQSGFTYILKKEED